LAKRWSTSTLFIMAVGVEVIEKERREVRRKRGIRNEAGMAANFVSIISFEMVMGGGRRMN